MSILKSPLLLLGILVIFIAGAALAVPWFIDWNAYRSEVQDYGRRLIGRDVRIAGNLSVRLFPWPALALDEVRIANPPGAKVADLMHAKRVVARLSLVSLIQGEVRMEKIAIEEPTFALERLASGEGTWKLSPEIDLGKLIDIEKVVLAGITVANGTLLLSDVRRGGVAKLENVEALVSAPSLAGPWRLRSIVSSDGSQISVGVSTGRIRADEAFKFALRIGPVEGEGGLSYAFDGTMPLEGDGPIEGGLIIAPVAGEGGKRDAETMRPVIIKSQVKATFDEIQLNGIEIAPESVEEGGNLVSGEARVTLGSSIVMKADLDASRVDLDTIAGRGGRQYLGAEGLERLKGFLHSLPLGIEAQLKLDVASLVAGGEELDNVRLAAEFTPERISIAELSAEMPGNTHGTFSGTFLPSDIPQLAGDVKLDAMSLRDFVHWVYPAGSSDVDLVWSGARGKLDLTGKLDLSPSSLRLSDLDFTLDDAHGKGAFTRTLGAAPTINVRLSADHVNVDRYVPSGFAPVKDGSRPAVGLAELLIGAMGFGEAQFMMQADRLTLHGVEAANVTIDIGANDEAVELRTIDIGNVGSAKLDLVGVLKFPDEGIAGTLAGEVHAEQPAALLRLFGLLPAAELRAPDPAWTAAIAPLKLKLVSEAHASEASTVATVSVEGDAGGSRVALEGRFSGDPAAWRDAETHISGKITDANSAVLAAFAGLAPVSGGDLPAHLELTATGKPSEGLAATLETEAFGAGLRFVGTLGMPTEGPRANGRLALFSGTANDLYRSAGLAFEDAPQVLSVEGNIDYAGGTLSLTDLTGASGENNFGGSFGVTWSDGPATSVEGRLTLTRLELPELLAALVLPRDGQSAQPDEPFEAQWMRLVSGEVALEVGELAVIQGLALSNVRSTVVLADGEAKVSAEGRDLTGQPAKAELSLKPGAVELAAAARLQMSAPLGALLHRAEGAAAVEGTATVDVEMQGSGRSPTGLLSGLDGKGSITLADARLKGTDPLAFARELAVAKDPAAVDRLVSEVLRGGEMAFEAKPVSFAIKGGLLTVEPMEVNASGAKGTLRALFDIGRGEADISAEIRSEALEGLPSFELAYAGPPRQLAASYDINELKSYLSVQVLQSGIDKLEQLAREEQRILEEERKFAREQAIRRTEDVLRQRARKEMAERLAREAEAQRLADIAADIRSAEEIKIRRIDDVERRRQERVERRAMLEAKRKAREEEKRRAVEEIERKRQERAERRRQEQAAQRAAEEAARAAKAAERQAAEDARIKAAEDAAALKAAEAARRKAEREAQRKAAEEARIRAAIEAAAQKSADEAKRQAAEEAQRKAAEDARTKAEEARRRKADETKRRAEEAAARRATQDAARLAEEARRRAEAEAARVPQESRRRSEESSPVPDAVTVTPLGEIPTGSTDGGSGSPPAPADSGLGATEEQSRRAAEREVLRILQEMRLNPINIPIGGEGNR